MPVDNEYVILSPVRRNGRRHMPGATLKLNAADAAPLLRVGAIALPRVIAAETGERPDDSHPGEQIDGQGLAPIAANNPVALNINAATAEEIDRVIDGVGPDIAARVVAHREEHGPFASVDDLTAVNGIGRKTLDKHRGLLTV